MTTQIANTEIDRRILATGKEFFASIAGEKPSVFSKGHWTGKVMDWAMQNEQFKVQLFRFVDVLPYLNTTEALTRHIEEYFGGENDIPPVLKWGAEKQGLLGKLGAKVLSKTIRTNIEGMAKQFIIGENEKEAIKTLRKLRKQGFAFAADALGEACVNEAEADAYAAMYMDLIEALDAEQKKWDALGGKGELDWGHQPKINVSIKPSCFYSLAKPVAVEDSVQGIMARLKPLYQRIIQAGGALCIDMEQLAYKELTIELFKRLRADPDVRDYPHLSIVLQSYLRDTDHDLDDLLDWGRREHLPFGIRLVKGAYWDYETVHAKQCGWPVPVWVHKPESDMAFERQSRKILENCNLVYYQCGSHNIRSISHVLETARELGVPESRYEFQVLYGMAEPVRRGLLKVADRVRLYAPFGDLLPGMAYLVRRLLENTANESFLRQSFAGEAEIEQLLENPEISLTREKAEASERPVPCAPEGCLTPFRNDPFIDFTIPEVRADFQRAIETVRARMGEVHPLFIDGKDVTTEDRIESFNPAAPDELVGSVCQAGVEEIDKAVAAAARAHLTWRDVDPRERAEYLIKAAAVARDRIYELSAVQVLEVGKQWDQAYHDVTEAIDFMEYYARDMIRLGTPRRMGNAPGEHSTLFYQPKGVAAVIAPWNFPLAISAGMVSAAIVTGNPVVYKPSSLASVIGHGLVDIFREVGLPEGVFNYCPGRSRVMGDHLITHKDIALVVFTGSMDVGLHIQNEASRVVPGQVAPRRVIAEMGGKNAIIIDDDADLDEAVHGVIYSAFGFQGQKCSACSRVIVLEPIYERFIERLVGAAESFKIGPSEDPVNFVGPVASPSQQKTVGEYVALAEAEGDILVKREVPDTGCYVPPTIVTGVGPDHRLAQEEIFGPVLTVLKAADFDAALDIANGTLFALTGGIYSRSPGRLERARREFRVGNLYLNRGTTGALVERQPFGGFKMSGIGSKTGGPDYLLQFLDPRCVTENTMRRGFAPIEEDDDWVA
jgi:RHH-type proline utilization regulon transcriptional repressor/proline dehydrogenase/delta 1-pyrroline-5-carboxylate dehydrogenase